MAIRNEYLIVRRGKLAGAGAHPHGKGTTTTNGSEAAAKFRN